MVRKTCSFVIRKTKLYFNSFVRIQPITFKINVTEYSYRLQIYFFGKFILFLIRPGFKTHCKIAVLDLVKVVESIF